MARSYIDPSLVALATQPVAPPWNWNPGATFVEAYNEAQRNKREQEKMALEMELAEILLPYKKETAALQLEKLKQDVELSTLLTAQKRKAQSTAHPSIMDAVRNPSAPDDFGPFTSRSAPATPVMQQAPGKVLGGGLQPKRP